MAEGEWKAQQAIMAGEFATMGFNRDTTASLANWWQMQGQLDASNYWSGIEFNLANAEFAAQQLAEENQPTGDSGGGGGGCFHPEATVELEDGTIKTMKEVNYGDKIKAVDKNGNIIFSEVWKDLVFNNKDNTTPKYYITIKAGDSVLKVTKMHTIFVNDLKKNMCAWKVEPGLYVNVIEDGEGVLKIVD